MVVADVVGVVDGEVVIVVEAVEVMVDVAVDVAVVVSLVVGVDKWHAANEPSAWESIALFMIAAVVAQSSSTLTISPMVHLSCGVCSLFVYASAVLVMAFFATAQSC